MSDLDDKKFQAKETRAVAPAIPAQQRKKLGEILIERGILTPLTVERILAISTRLGKRFGSILEEIGLITGEELAQALAIQYGYKTVSSIINFSIPPEVLRLVTVETALEHTVFPLKVQNNTLALAMHDPTNERLIHNLIGNTNKSICPFICTRKDINAAIARHYLSKTATDSDDNTILVVEDEKLVLTTIANTLQTEGYKVLTAADGMEAFKEIISRKPKLIITDKEMPKLSGYALFDSLKNIPDMKNIPIILITASNNVDEETMAYEKGFFDYLPKPIKLPSLIAKVKRAMRTKTIFN